MCLLIYQLTYMLYIVNSKYSFTFKLKKDHFIKTYNIFRHFFHLKIKLIVSGHYCKRWYKIILTFAHWETVVLKTLKIYPFYFLHNYCSWRKLIFSHNFFPAVYLSVISHQYLPKISGRKFVSIPKRMNFLFN